MSIAHPRHSRRTLAITVVLAVALAVALALLLTPDAHAALQKLTGYEKSDDNRFSSLYSYLANLRDAILPLAIPVSTIGLVVVGGMYMFGSPAAGRTLSTLRSSIWPWWSKRRSLASAGRLTAGMVSHGSGPAACRGCRRRRS